MQESDFTRHNNRFYILNEIELKIMIFLDISCVGMYIIEFPYDVDCSVLH